MARQRKTQSVARPMTEPTAMKTVPSGMLDFCMKGAFLVGGTEGGGYVGSLFVRVGAFEGIAISSSPELAPPVILTPPDVRVGILTGSSASSGGALVIATPDDRLGLVSSSSSSSLSSAGGGVFLGGGFDVVRAGGAGAGSVVLGGCWVCLGGVGVGVGVFLGGAGLVSSSSSSLLFPLPFPPPPPP